MAIAITRPASTGHGRGLAKITLLLRPGDRLEVLRHQRPVSLGDALAAAAGQAIVGRLFPEARRQVGFIALERKVHVLAQRLPFAEILLERFVARRGAAELVLLRRGPAAASLLGLHPAERLARALQLARIFNAQ